MGTKISALTETGSAPTGAYYPLEYENANYKISTETLRGNLGGKYVEGYASSIGGTTVDDGALLTVTHNLGTEDVLVQIYIADDADGTNNVMLNNQSDGQGSYVYDYQVQAADTNSIKVQLSASGWSKNDGTSTVLHVNYRFGGVSKFIKVVVLSAGAGDTSQKVIDSAAIGNSVTVDYKIGDLQGQNEVIISASIRHSLIAKYFQINATYGRSDSGGTRSLSASVDSSPYTKEDGHGPVLFYGSSTADFYLYVVGDEVFVRIINGSSGAGTVYWSYLALVGGGGGAGSTNKYVADWAQSHGGVTVANGATMTITHNLGTADVQVMAYVNSSASNTDAQEVGMMVHNSGGTQFDCGNLVTSLATNSIVLQLGQDGYNDITSGGGLATTSFASKYIKVVVIG